MVYLVFDLDSTIANVGSVIFLLQDLTGSTWNSNNIPVNSELNFKLKHAYKLFVSKIANLEKNSSTRIGILRPGILEVMEIAKFLMENHMCSGVIIYSNNFSLNCLEFIRDVIHSCLSTVNLIKDCIHRFNKLRLDISGNNIINNNINKTWNSLHNLLVNGKVKAQGSIDPSQVLFFDDNLHPNLIDNLRENYIHVPSYTYNIPWVKIEEIYRDTIKESQLINFEFIKFLNKFNQEKITTIREHLYYYKMRYLLIRERQDSENPPAPDYSINLMLLALQNKFL